MHSSTFFGSQGHVRDCTAPPVFHMRGHSNPALVDVVMAAAVAVVPTVAGIAAVAVVPTAAGIAVAVVLTVAGIAAAFALVASLGPPGIAAAFALNSFTFLLVS